ncbi:hypothetical protein E1B28_008240 [Marasmius oreades]|nr:uncharacterized protein E1B28_008240 [Marasmius oreades]KAG7091835.1 hypothetical protein E1B28_008240 [Marasmius oreades]
MLNLITTFFLFLWTTFLCGPTTGSYTLHRDYSGQDFFTGWDYYGFIDNTTWGNVTYVDRDTATNQKLTYVDPTTSHAIIRVDNTTNIPPGPLVNRPTVKITTKDAFNMGSLFIIDVNHLPYGCSVWPSFWTLGINFEWPDAGEIDIIEGINNLPFNQMALHTTNGCFQASNPGQSGRTITTNCTLPEGCLVQETKPNSFGAAFSQAGGGVFATQLDVSGVYIWFWSRPDVPHSITSASKDSHLNLTDWGAPSASYPASGCDIGKFFQPQKLVLDTTLCGTWAGVPSIYAQTCGNGNGQCVSNVFGNGSNYGTAWWDISYVRVYLAVADSPPATSSMTGTATMTTASTGGTGVVVPSDLPTARPGNSSVGKQIWSWGLGVSSMITVLWFIS